MFPVICLSHSLFRYLSISLHVIQIEEPKAPLTDPWEPVKPHESAAPIRKRRKGRTSKAPTPNIVLTRTGTRSRRREADGPLPAIDHFVANVMASRGKTQTAIKQVSCRE